MKRFLTSASGSSSAAQPGSPYPDTCDAGVRSAEQPAEQNNFDPESRIDFYVCMYVSFQSQALRLADASFDTGPSIQPIHS